jgi:hypothetical protein
VEEGDADDDARGDGLARRGDGPRARAARRGAGDEVGHAIREGGAEGEEEDHRGTFGPPGLPVNVTSEFVSARAAR